MKGKKMQHEITFEEVFVTLLKQYRHGMVICILCLAAIFLYLQIAILPNAKKQVDITEETKQNIIEYIEKQTLLNETIEYLENSVLMSCDPYEAGYLILEFSIEGREITSSQWNRCMNPLEDTLFQNELMSIFSEMNDMKYLREIVSCTDISHRAVGNEKLLHLQILCPDTKKQEEIAKTATSYIERVFMDTTCEVQTLQNSYSVQVNHELATLQSQQKNLVASLKAELDKTLLNMSQTEQMALDQYSEGQLPDNVTIHETVKQYQYYLLAVILSVLIYICYEIMKLSWSSKIQNEYILKSELGIDILCEVEKKKGRNPIDKMIEKVKKRLWRIAYPLFEESELLQQLPHQIQSLENTVFISSGEKLEKKAALIFHPFPGKENLLQNCDLLFYTKQLDLGNIEKVILFAQYNDSYYEDIACLQEKCKLNRTVISGVIFFR